MKKYSSMVQKVCLATGNIGPKKGYGGPKLADGDVENI